MMNRNSYVIYRTVPYIVNDFEQPLTYISR